MKQTVSNRMDDGLIAQQSLAESIELLLATNDSLFFWGKGMPIAHIIKGGKSHD